MKKKQRRSMPLFWRLMAGIMACWFVLLSAALTVTMRYSMHTLQEQIDSILMSTVVTLSNSPSIQRAVERGSCDEEMVDYLTDVVVNTENLEFITIADRNSLRLYHIDPAFVGPISSNTETR